MPLELWPILLAIGLAIGIGFLFQAMFARSRVLLRRWAADNGFELLEYNYRMIRKGPFWWSQRGQVVYRVRIRDRQGRERAGWVRCGSILLGVFGDQVEGRLDD